MLVESAEQAVHYGFVARGPKAVWQAINVLAAHLSGSPLSVLGKAEQERFFTSRKDIHIPKDVWPWFQDALRLKIGVTLGLDIVQKHVDITYLGNDFYSLSIIDPLVRAVDSAQAWLQQTLAARIEVGFGITLAVSPYLVSFPDRQISRLDLTDKLFEPVRQAVKDRGRSVDLLQQLLGQLPLSKPFHIKSGQDLIVTLSSPTFTRQSIEWWIEDSRMLATHAELHSPELEIRICRSDGMPFNSDELTAASTLHKKLLKEFERIMKQQ